MCKRKSAKRQTREGGRGVWGWRGGTWSAMPRSRSLTPQSDRLQGRVGANKRVRVPQDGVALSAKNDEGSLRCLEARPGLRLATAVGIRRHSGGPGTDAPTVSVLPRLAHALQSPPMRARHGAKIRQKAGFDSCFRRFTIMLQQCDVMCLLHLPGPLGHEEVHPADALGLLRWQRRLLPACAKPAR